MVAAPDEPGRVVQDYVKRLGVREGQVIAEIGWDDDADSRISEGIEDVIGASLVDYDTDEICDVVLLWWRDGDEDLVDVLVDCIRLLASQGSIWLLTPGAGTPGTVDQGVINESAQLAGLIATRSERLGGWQAAQLVQRGS